MEIGQYVHHTRNPHFGVGKVLENNINGSCKVVFQSITISGVMRSDLEPVSEKEQDRLELEEAKRGGSEAMDAWKNRQEQKKRIKHEKIKSMYNRLARYGFEGMEAHFDDELERLLSQTRMAQTESKPDKAEGNNPHQAASGSGWWYKAFQQPRKREKPQVVETKVVGVTYEGRQKAIADMEENEKILLVREPDNPFDCNAIAVKRINGRCIGYLPREEAAGLAGKFDIYGKAVSGKVIAILGKHYIDSTLGLRIRFSLPGPEQGANNVETSDNQNNQHNMLKAQ
jgi:hypothetical protein